MSLLDKFKNAGGQKPKVAANATTLATAQSHRQSRSTG